MKKSLIGLSLLALGLASGAYAAETMPGGDPLGDKTVTKAEFQAKGTAMFDKMDANRDGKLDAADRTAHNGHMFDQVDANHDGALSRDEFMAAHQHGPADGHADGKRRGHGAGHGGGMMMLKMADTNKDGAVSRDEFLAAHAHHFDMMDANHDGRLTQPERKAGHDKMHAMSGKGSGGMRHDGKHGDHKMGDMQPPPPAN